MQNHNQDMFARRLGRGFFLLIILSSLCFTWACSQTQLSQLTAVGQKKTKLLNETLSNFTRALYWGSVDEASAFVKADMRRDFVVQEKKKKKEEKIVELEPDDVVYDVGSDEAQVTVSIKYYKVPFYVVKKRTEKQTWKYFRFDGGWLLVEREFFEDEETS